MNPRIAERLVRAARAAQALSEALWEALHEELIDPRGQRVAELSARLADVSLAVASLARVEDEAPSTHEAPSTPRAPSISGDGETGRAPTPKPPAGPAEQESAATRAMREESRGGSSILESPTAQEHPAVQERQPALRPPSIAVLIDELAPEAEQGIEIRDERADRAETAWIVSIGRRLERYERDGAPFAVLLIELVDIERLRHAELPGEVARLTGLLETALSGELRPADSLTRESPGRYWLLAPETDPSSAQSLAESLAEAVRHAASHRGTPLQVSVGIAVCPMDGTQATALAAHADVALYAARAAGRPVAP